MKRSAQYLWLLVLALWLPCTMHCTLEAAGVTLSNCCESALNEGCPAGPAAADPCHDCHGCSSVESDGMVKADSSVPIQPLLAVVCILVRPEAMLAPAAAEAAISRAVSPPEPPPSWQFAERAAQPPRAPSTQA